MHPRRLRPVRMDPEAVDSEFWTPRLRVLHDATVPALLGRFAQPDGGAYGNFDRVRDGAVGGHQGFPWYDGLVHQTIGGAAQLVRPKGNEALRSRLESIITRIAAAQDAGPDGYLNTWTTLMAPDKRWGTNGGNLRWQHDLYNAGCLVEAAVRHHRATGSDAYLDVAIKLVRHLCATLGSPPRLAIVPAHPLPEKALLDLARLLAEDPALQRRYPAIRPRALLRLVRFWLDDRGRHRDRGNHLPNLQSYAQDHVPLLRQREAVGHAVRATLLYAGMAAFGRTAGGSRYLRAALRLWNDVTGSKMHVTGGVGALAQEEMFGPAYYLPNDAYLETCAGVGMAQWSHEMTLAFGASRFADVHERALYNNVLAGISLEGTRFFYRNPLRSDGDHHRWEWHACPCCPPMLLKQLGALGDHVYAVRGSTIFISHYVGGRAVVAPRRGSVALRQATRYPWEGSVTLSLDSCPIRPFAIALRIPDWCDTWTISVNGAPAAGAGGEGVTDRGYVLLRRRWKPGDTVRLEMDMPVTLVEANPYVEADRGKVAIQRGPVVYCLEEADSPQVEAIALADHPRLTPRWAPDLLGGVVVVDGECEDGRAFTAVPYFAWDNRSGGQTNRMVVWIPRRGSWDPARMVWNRPEDLRAWAGRLYRRCWPAPQANREGFRVISRSRST